MSTKKKILILCPQDKHFYEHLMPIGQEAIKRGYHVSVYCLTSTYTKKIEDLGITVINSKNHRGSLNPFKEVIALLNTIKVIRQTNANIISNFTIKMILYGSISSIFSTNKPHVINSFLGMGYIFTHRNALTSLLKQVITICIKFSSQFRTIKNITQNADDQKLVQQIWPQIPCINQCSVGVHMQDYTQYQMPTKGKVIFALVARMLKDKGVLEFVEAAKILKKRNINAEFWLVGTPDTANKMTINANELAAINNAGYVKYLGFQNIHDIWKKAHIAVLPSYREGLSRTLLEAAACGRTVITADAPGGRELIRHNENGLLVRSKNAGDLAKKMEILALNHQLAQTLANALFKEVTDKYNAELLAQKNLDCYEDFSDTSKHNF